MFRNRGGRSEFLYYGPKHHVFASGRDQLSSGGLNLLHELVDGVSSIIIAFGGRSQEQPIDLDFRAFW